MGDHLPVRWAKYTKLNSSEKVTLELGKLESLFRGVIESRSLTETEVQRMGVLLESLLNNLTSVQKQFPKDSDAYLANSPHTILKEVLARFLQKIFVCVGATLQQPRGNAGLHGHHSKNGKHGPASLSAAGNSDPPSAEDKRELPYIDGKHVELKGGGGERERVAFDISSTDNHTTTDPDSLLTDTTTDDEKFQLSVPANTTMRDTPTPIPSATLRKKAADPSSDVGSEALVGRMSSTLAARANSRPVSFDPVSVALTLLALPVLQKRRGQNADLPLLLALMVGEYIPRLSASDLDDVRAWIMRLAEQSLASVKVLSVLTGPPLDVPLSPAFLSAWMMALVARGKHADACELAVRFKLGDDVDCKLFLGPLLLGGGHQAAVSEKAFFP